MTSWLRSNRWEILLFVITGIAILALGRLEGPITYQHPLRQSQVALSIYWMIKDGVNLLLPALPIFGIDQPVIAFEFPIFQALAALPWRWIGSQDLITSALLSGRLLNILSFLACGFLTAKLGLVLFNRQVGQISQILFYTLPMNVYWSFNVTIEFFAVSMTLAYLILTIEVFKKEKPSTLDLLFIFVFGILAGLSKMTTLLLIGPAIIWIVLRGIWASYREWGIAGWHVLALISYCLPLLVSLAWIAWTEHLRAQNTYLPEILVPPALWNHIFGSLAQRVELATWGQLASNWIYVFFGPLLCFFAIGILKSGRTSNVLLLLAPNLVAFLVFTNLYFLHDYYHLAILPFAIILVSVGLAAVVFKPGRQGPLVAALVAVIAAGVVWGQMFLLAPTMRFDFTWDFLSAPTGKLPAYVNDKRQRNDEAVRILRTKTIESDVALIANSSITSYIALMAERRVVMANRCKISVYYTDQTLAAAGHVDHFLLWKKRQSCRQLKVPDHCIVTSTKHWISGSCMTIELNPSL